jgi:hypothetical protein
MVLLPKRDSEERAIRRFLDYYNKSEQKSYTIKEWLDRTPRTGRSKQEPIPDCLCIDSINGSEMVIERTMLTGEQDLKLTQGAEKFLIDVRTQLKCKLSGVFLLHDWGTNAIKFTSRDRNRKITQLCQQILTVAPTLADGEEISLSHPFPVKLRKEEAYKVKTDCALIWIPPEGKYTSNRNRLDQQFKRALDEANRKFKNYSEKQTVLLINIWESGLDYEELKTALFEGIDMDGFSNIKHIYLSEGLPNPPIYHLWSSSKL